LIGDIHLYSLKVRARELMGKRLMGHTNLWLSRRHRFNHRMLEKVMQKVEAIAPDLAVFSGDVTTTSLANEFHDINEYLHPLSQKVPVLLVPGNHDRYTFRSARKQRMEKALEGIMPLAFPHWQKLTDRWYLLALDSAIPQLMLSRGALGETQLKAIARRLAQLKAGDGLVVLCHYPVALPAGWPRTWTHDLAKGQQLRRLLENCPAKVVFLHGHVHKPWYARPTGHDGLPFICINAGSPCMTSNEFPLGQGFWEIALPDDPADALDLTHHVLEPRHDPATVPDREAEHLDPQWVGHAVK